jgi:tetratricopeptide (TPR) repeat protein
MHLANDMTTNYSKSIEKSSIDSTVYLYRESLRLRLNSDVKRAFTLSALADAPVIRYQIAAELNDLEESIELFQEALALTSPQDSSRFLLIIRGCVGLFMKFGQSSNLADMMRTLELRILAAKEDEKASELNQKGADLFHVFEQSGGASNLDSAISYFYESLWLRLEGHPCRTQSLNNLAAALSTRFEQKGQLGDLDESIRLHREALDLFPSRHPNRSTSLSSLAKCLLLHS